MSDLPDKKVLMKEYKMIIKIFQDKASREKNGKNVDVNGDALKCLAGVHHCSVKYLKIIMFD